MSETPVWRNVLSILVTCFLVIRLLYTCSNMNNRDSSAINPEIMNFQDTQKVMRESMERNKKLQKIFSNNIMYKTYQGVDSLSAVMKDNYGILKIEKDTSIVVDFTTTINIPKGFYVQKNHDDTLRMAFKSPENLNIFIHDFQSKDTLASNFKILKRDKDLQKFKEQKVTIFSMITYNITNDTKKYNGYAFCFKVEDYQSFYEFESPNLTSDELREKVHDYLHFGKNRDTKKK